MLPVSPTPELALHTPWLVYEKKSKVLQAHKNWKSEKGKNNIRINQTDKIEDTVFMTQPVYI